MVIIVLTTLTSASRFSKTLESSLFQRKCCSFHSLKRGTRRTGLQWKSSLILSTCQDQLFLKTGHLRSCIQPCTTAFCSSQGTAFTLTSPNTFAELWLVWTWTWSWRKPGASPPASPSRPTTATVFPTWGQPSFSWHSTTCWSPSVKSSTFFQTSACTWIRCYWALWKRISRLN